MTKRGPTPGRWHAEPLFPEKVLEIARLRDDESLTFEEIAARVGGTRMNCCSLYNRWRVWTRARRAVAAE